MSVWLIRPRDPLIFRDGRPFHATPGARARSLPFPFPSTLAGAVRTRAGRNASGRFDPKRADELLSHSVRGPLLAGLDERGELQQWYLPAPADSLIVECGDARHGQLYRRRPVALPPGAATDLALETPVSVSPAIKAKPHAKLPQFWNWQALQAWLEHPQEDGELVELSRIGISGLTPQSRVHVSIDGDTGTAREEFLFQTSGLEFATVCLHEHRKALSGLQEYALALVTDLDIARGVDFLGGERRVVHWAWSDRSLPVCPDGIRDAIVEQAHCRLALATPAVFEGGYLPKWVLEATPGVTAALVAAAVPRFQAVSGWDARKGTQKASRRLAPAGSVYFLSLQGDGSAVRQFVDRVWMQPVSDDEQDRLDGFGLALLGVWDGRVDPMEVNV